MIRYNPFRPNSIVVPGMFAGRLAELSLLERGLFQTKHGNPWHFLVHGERGIGKSSLLMYVDLMGEGTSLECDPVDFITVQVELEHKTTYRELIGRIGREFAKKVGRRESVRTAASGVWDFLKKWEVLGVKYDSSGPATSNFIEDLSTTISNAMARLGDSVDGAMILIDEADKGAASCQLGEFLKMFTERLTRARCDRVMVGVSGISHVIQQLSESHESSVRILNAMELKPLEIDERKRVVMLGLGTSNKRHKDEEPISIDPEALDWIAVVSEGYPHFIQQYAYSAFETNTDTRITIEDVQFAVQKENGALDQLGMRYFEDLYLEQAASDNYREILQIMAEHPSRWIMRAEIQALTKIPSSTLGSALASLRKKGVILAQRGKKGSFRLPTDSFAAWIRARGKAHKEQFDVKRF